MHVLSISTLQIEHTIDCILQVIFMIVVYLQVIKKDRENNLPIQD